MSSAKSRLNTLLSGTNWKFCKLNTVFTWMQDGCNPKRPPPPQKKKLCAKGKCIYPNLRPPLKNKISAKNIFYYFIHSVHTAHQLLSTCTTQFIVSIITFGAFIFLTFAPNIPILFTAIPQNIISPMHCIECRILLKTLHRHYWWDELPCWCDPYWLNYTFMFLGL